MGTERLLEDNSLTIRTYSFKQLDELSALQRAQVPGVEQIDFIEAALNANTNCPTSRLLNTVISMNAHLIA